jgi:hypothetical protein
VNDWPLLGGGFQRIAPGNRMLTTAPPTASPRITWLCVVSYVSSEIAARE